MPLRCPYCHVAIELTNDQEGEDISCPACGSTFNVIAGHSTASYHPAEGRHLDQFELIEQIGAGHFGAVWKALDTTLDRTVAIKLPRRDDVSDEDSAQFLREARAAAQLHHPGIVAVHDIGRADSTIYIVSDYVQGATLREWLTAQRLTPREAAELLVKLADAVHHAHEAGVVHRDLKPANIMLDLQGEPKIMDFGLAKRETGEITVTVEGKIVGTPAYMSPEQASGDGHEADRRSDIYSLGVILFELLTGELPFRGDVRMLIVQILRDEPPSPRKFNNVIPRDLETICLKCLQKCPSRRYQTAAELADDLKRWLQHKPILARPVGRIERLARWRRRHPGVAILLCLVVFITVAGFTGVLWQWRETALARDDVQENFDRSEAHRKRRELNYDRALAAVDKMLTHVGAEQLASIPELTPVRRAILEDALQMYKDLAKDSPDDPALLDEVAKAHMRVAAISTLLDDHERVAEAYTSAISILEELRKGDPENEGYAERLASCHLTLVQEFERARKFPEDSSHFVAAIDLYEWLLNRDPTNVGNRFKLASAHYRLQNYFLALDSLIDAEHAGRVATTLMEQAYESSHHYFGISLALGWAYYWRAEVAMRDGRSPDAIIHLRRAIEIRAEHLKRPTSQYNHFIAPIEHIPSLRNKRSLQLDLADWKRKIAQLVRSTDPADADRLEQEAGVHENANHIDLKSMVQKNPEHVLYREMLARSHLGEANQQAQAKNHEGAAQLLHSAALEWDALLKRDSQNLDYLLQAAETSIRLGELYGETLKRTADASAAFHSAVDRLKTISQQSAATGRPEDRVKTFQLLSDALYGSGQIEAARQALIEALEICLTKFPEAEISHNEAQMKDLAAAATTCLWKLSELIDKETNDTDVSLVMKYADTFWQQMSKRRELLGSWSFYNAAIEIKSHGFSVEAARLCEYAIAVAKIRLAKQSTPGLQVQFVIFQGLLANIYNSHLARRKDAENLYRENLAILTEVLNANPNNRHAIMQLVWQASNCARTIPKTERAEERVMLLTKAVEVLNSNPWLEFSPTQRAGFRIRMAQEILSLAQVDPERLKHAAEQSRLAVSEDANSAFGWRTLGIVRFRLEECPPAIEAHQKASTLDGDKNGESHFYLAMCEFRTGEQQKAEEYLNLAIQRMEKSGSVAPILQKLRDDAITLLKPASTQ